MDTTLNISLQEADEAGIDYDRAKMMDDQAVDIDIRNRRKKKKMNPDEGFSGMQVFVYYMIPDEGFSDMQVFVYNMIPDEGF